jgi:hypothetical protein
MYPSTTYNYQPVVSTYQPYYQQPIQRSNPNPNVGTKNNSNKVVDNKRVAITTTTWNCQSCKREFSLLKAYQEHMATHEKCTFDGCEFEGSKKVVSTHFQTAHGEYSGTGYKVIEVEGEKFKVLMGTNSDEVEQWRLERRKKFPTAKNIELKQGQKKILQDAGGLEWDDSSLSSKNKNKKNRNNANGKRQRETDKTDEGNDRSNKKADTSVAECVVNGTMPDDLTVSPTHSSGALSMLTGYDSDSDSSHALNVITSSKVCSVVNETSDVGTIDKLPSTISNVQSKETKELVISRRSKPCHFFQKGMCKKGENCKFRHAIQESGGNNSGSNKLSNDLNLDKDAMKLHASHEEKNKHKKSGIRDIPKPLGSDDVKETLFSKLIEKDTFAEENVLLQCIRYIISNNFFENIESSEE